MRRIALCNLLLFAILGCNHIEPSVLAGAPRIPTPKSEVLLPEYTQARAAEPDKKDDVVKPAKFTPDLNAATKGKDGLPAPEGKITASVLARVNGQPILAEEVLNAASWRLEEVRPRVPPEQWPSVQAEIIKQELEDIIDREVILQDALSRIRPLSLSKLKDGIQQDFEKMLRKQKEQLKLKTDEDLRRYLEKSGRSFDEMQRQYERSQIARAYISNLIRPKVDAISREDLLEYYQKNDKEFNKPERVTWQHLYIDVDRFPTQVQARQGAESIVAMLKAVRVNEDVEAIATNYSHGTSRFRKGEGEGNERGQIRPQELEELVLKLKPGEVGPIVDAARGYHIVRVVDHQTGGKTSFDKAIPDIRKKLQNKIFATEYKKIVEEMRAKTHIENGLTR